MINVHKKTKESTRITRKLEKTSTALAGMKEHSIVGTQKTIHWRMPVLEPTQS